MSTGKDVLGITGSFGYIGTRLLERLKDDTRFSRIICTDIMPPPDELPGRFEYCHCDIRDGHNLRDIFQKNEVNTVIHLAFIAYPTRDPGFEYDVDVKGMGNILRACSELPIKKLVVASSDCAYGFFEGTCDYLDENTPTRPTPGFPYSENKAAIEKLIADFANTQPGCSVVVIRPCIVIGPNCNSATGESMKEKAIIGVRGYDPIMQFIHEDDAANAFYLAALSNSSGAYNLAADEGLRYSELAELLGKPFVQLPAWLIYNLVEALYRLRVLKFGKAQLDYIRYPLSMNADKIRRDLSFNPEYTSRQAVLSYKENW